MTRTRPAASMHLRPDEGALVGPAGWTHGDFHDLNMLWDAGQVSAVLDWGRLGVQPLAGEVVRSATMLFGYGDDRGLDTSRVTAFTCGYRAVVPLAGEQLVDAAHPRPLRGRAGSDACSNRVVDVVRPAWWCYRSSARTGTSGNWAGSSCPGCTVTARRRSPHQARPVWASRGALQRGAGLPVHLVPAAAGASGMSPGQRRNRAARPAPWVACAGVSVTFVA